MDRAATGGWLVVWRDAETGERASRLVKWNVEQHTGREAWETDGEITPEEARATAERLGTRSS